MANELHIACQEGDLEKVKALITNDPSLINQPHTILSTYPIFFAAENGNLHIIKYLLDNSSTKTVMPHYSLRNLLFYCCDCTHEPKRAEMLQFIYTNFELCKFEGKINKLHVAAAIGNYEYCASHKDNLLQFDENSVPPIFYSLIMNQQKIVELVFSQEGDIQKFILSILKSQILHILQDFDQAISIMTECQSKYISSAMVAISLNINEYEQIIQKYPAENLNFLSNEYRDLAILKSLVGQILLNNNTRLEAITSFKEAVAALENVIDKSDEDRNRLNDYHRNIATLYSDHGESLDDDENYLESITAFKEAVAALENVIDKSHKDKTNLNTYHYQLAYTYEEYGDKLYDDKKFQEASVAFKESINFRNRINVKNDTDYVDNARCYLHLAQIHSSFQVILEPVQPVRYFQNAIKELSNIQLYNQDSCSVIRKIYENWRNYYRPNSYEWYFAELARKLFSTAVNGETFEQIFLPIYNEIKNSHRLSESSSLCGSLIQLMELLLKFSENNDLIAINQLLGAQFILASNTNKELFKEKLNELKRIPDPSLSRDLEHHTSTLVAIVSKMKAMENNIQQLMLENQSLKAALQSAASLSSQHTRSQLADPNIQLDNTALPIINSVQTTTPMATKSINPASIVPSSLNNKNLIWHQKRKHSQDETTDVITPQLISITEEQPVNETISKYQKSD